MPPASAEHVLGDLSETCTTVRQYIFRLATILPAVIWSQIRRRATMAGLIANAVITAIVLVVAQGVPNAAFFGERGAWLRLALLWALWVAGCALAAAYGPRDKPASWNSRLFLATIVVTLLAAAATGVPLVRVMIAIGAVIALALVVSMPWITWRSHYGPLTPETLPAHARMFQNGIWWRNVREIGAGAVVLISNGWKLWQPGADDRVPAALLVAGILFVIAYLCFRAGPRRVPEGADTPTLIRFHRAEIARQRDILRAVPLWYLLPFVPGLVAAVIARWHPVAGPVALGVCAVLFWGVWLVNAGGARWLDKQMQSIDALEDRC